MRSRILPFLVLLVACSAGGELASTTSRSTTTLATVSTAPSSTTATAAAVSTTAALAPLAGLTYTEIASGLPFPILLTFRPSDGLTFLATKDGQVWTLGADGFEPYLDITDRVIDGGLEQGLLGMAWHPDEADRLFLHYSDGNGDTVISEFNGAEERVVLTADQPAGNHNGGMIAFGPDGYLYIGLGDGGGAGDTFGNGQPVTDLLGGLLRIDVDGEEPYAIPPDNPYVDGSGAPEVWASGLRNPWRFWFDEDLLYIGDVGQGAYEEIDVTPAGAAGLNYGWPITEGLHCFDPPQGCDTSDQIPPVLEVPHSDAGTCSITGGVVYRGEAIPELTGRYFYTDYCGGYLRSFILVDGQVTDPQDFTSQMGKPGPGISFGTDAAGEIYFLTDSSVYRIDGVR